MDELVQEKLKAMGIPDPSKELVASLNEWKRRQDAVRPGPLSLDAIVCCTMLCDMFKREFKREEKDA